MPDDSNQSISGKRVQVAFTNAAHEHAARKLAHDADRVVGELADLLRPAESAAAPFALRLVDELPAGTPDPAVLVRLAAPDAHQEPLQSALTRYALQRWYGDKVRRLAPLTIGIAGFVAARLKLGASLQEAGDWVTAEVKEHGTVRVLARPGGPPSGPPGGPPPPPGGAPPPPPPAGAPQPSAAGQPGAPPMPPGARPPGAPPGAPPPGARSAAPDPRACTSFVSFMVRSYGGAKIGQFLAAYEPERVDASALAAFQRTLGEVEEAWLAGMRSGTGLVGALKAFWRALAPLLSPQKGLVGLIIFLTIIAAACNQAPVLAVNWIVGQVQVAAMHVRPGVTGMDVAKDFALTKLSWEIPLLLAVVFINGFVSMSRTVKTTQLNQRVLVGLQARLFEHLTKLSHSFYSEAKVGDIMARLTGDSTTAQQALGEVFNTGLAQGLTLVFSAIAFVVLTFGSHSQVLDIFVAVMMSAFTLTFLAVRKQTTVASREQQRRIGEVNATIQEALNGQALIKAFGMQGEVQDAYKSRVQNQMSAALELTKLNAKSSLSVAVMVSVTQIGVLGFCAYKVLTGSMQYGTLMALNAYVLQMMGPIAALTGLGQSLQGASGALERVIELLKAPVTVDDKDNAADIVPMSREISLDHVTFGYGPGRTILKDLSLAINAGSNVAVVGPSGCGKSTLISMIVRFYDPVSGTVKFDDTDLRDVKLDSLRLQTAIVFQDTFIFDTTLRHNIAIGRPSASDSEIAAAADGAGLGDLVGRMPDGFDTMLGERGARLSGGERQRIAIARAILRDPKILILDEATSALDARTEAGLLETLSKVAKGRTTISITHRLSWAAAADRVIVLENGQLQETGPHSKLVTAGGLYQQLYEEQTGSALELAPSRLSAAVYRLRQAPLFASLSIDDLVKVAERIGYETFAADAEVVRQGDPGETMYVVQSGRLEVVHTENGAETQLATLSPGDYFGEMALLGDGRRTATVRAISQAKLYSLNRADFVWLLGRVPGLADSVAETAKARQTADSAAMAVETAAAS